MRVSRWLSLSTLLGLLGAAVPANAEWQVKPFLGVTFGIQNTFVDTGRAAGKPKVVLGGSGALMGEVLGLEADFGRSSGFFQSGRGGNVLASGVTTLTGNITVGLPRKRTEYTLRPYFVGGAGLMRVAIDQVASTLNVSENMAAIDLGGGVTGFLTRRVGLNWDIRHFRTVNGRVLPGVALGAAQLSFWRADMALAFRY